MRTLPLIFPEVVDPEVGDWGWIHFGERDITKWKNTKKIELPPTRRMHTQGDGGYFPGVLNSPPEIWVRIRRDGIFLEGKDQPITVNTNGDCYTNCNNANVNALRTITIAANTMVEINPSGAARVLPSGKCCCASSCAPTYKDACCGATPSGKMCCASSCSPSACTQTMKCKPDPVNELLGKLCARG